MNFKVIRGVFAVACLAALAMMQLPVSATTYYVSTTGSDVTGNGSSAKPWASIDYADANSLLLPGDIVNVKAGTYNVDTAAKGGYGVNISAKSIGVTYQADAAGVTIHQSNSTGGTALVLISTGLSTSSGNRTVFSGFKINGGSPGGINVWVYGSSNVEISNCVIDPTGFTPWYNLMTYTASGVYIHNNVIVNGACAWDSRFSGTKWYNNTFEGSWSGWAMTFGGYQNGYQPGTWGSPGAPLTADRDEFINNIVDSGNYAGFYVQPSTGFTYPLSVTHDYNMFCNTPSPFGGQAAQAAHETTNVDAMLDSAYHPVARSPAIDAGIDVGLPYYGLRPDIGAFESTKVGGTFNPRTAAWYAYGADGVIDVSIIRWRDDLRGMKMAGLDGVWEVNVWADYITGGSWTQIPNGTWKEDMVARLKHRVKYATSQGLMVNIGLAYSAASANFLLDDTQFDLLRSYVDRIVRETSIYPNVVYTLCTEVFIGAGYLTAPVNPGDPSYADFPLWVAHFKNWCYNQNPNISYWNSRWGTSFTWDNIMPAYWMDGYGGNRHRDHVRWLYAVQRPRYEDLANVIKGIAPNCILGFHEWLGDPGVTNPADSPLAGTDKFDFVSTGLYGGLSDAQMNVTRLRTLYPGYPLYFCELGTSPTIHQSLLTGPYLESQHAGYNWWTSWQTYYSADQWNLIDDVGRRRSTYALLPNAANYGTIRGVITNAATGSVLRNVGVVAGAVNVESVDNGVYRIDLDPGTYTVEFVQAGYERKFVTGVVVAAGQDTTVSVALNPITNKVANPGFDTNLNGWSSQTISSGGFAMVSYDDILHPTWGLFDAVEGQGYFVMGAWPSPGEKVVYQDVAVSPNTTYTLSWWEKLVGDKFDGWSATSADQWLRVSLDQAQGTTWGGPIINLHQVQDACDWRRVETIFKTGPATTKIRVKFDAKFVSGQSFTGAFDTPRVGIDCVQLLSSVVMLTEASSIADAKNQPNGSLVAVSGVGTACFSNSSPACGYIESPDRTSAIKVYTANTSIGNPMTTVRVVGHVSTNALTGEKEITDEYGIQNTGAGSIKPVGMINKSVGKSYGLGTTGLLIRTFGTVKSIASGRKSFVIDDGSGTPVNVTDFGYDVPVWMQVGSYVQLTGISSLLSDGGGTVRCLRVPQWNYDTLVPWRP